jgi:RNA polymerase sigma-70 factor (ECF subfamily)
MQETDHSVVRAVLAGDMEAYGALVRAHSETVFRVAHGITGNEADAEEIVQEVFWRGYQSLKNFEQRSTFRTWIYRIAVNCALNRVNQREIRADYRPGEETNADERTVQVAAQDPDPERVLLSHEIGAAQQLAMQRLTPTERSAFVLRHFEDRPMNEIAQLLGVAPNAAKQAVFRAVQKLRRELGTLWGNA